uniref:SJCHGC09076 protein n=1 Tax=Schistosoma japonicum TaxID=6182 RepID=Q5DC94_SCHJA|nr:SJCHGC09076 protein [Schistosoma japonicum]
MKSVLFADWTCMTRNYNLPVHSTPNRSVSKYISILSNPGGARDPISPKGGPNKISGAAFLKRREGKNPGCPQLNPLEALPLFPGGEKTKKAPPNRLSKNWPPPEGQRQN